MKAALLANYLGTRISEEAHLKSGPMIEIDRKSSGTILIAGKMTLDSSNLTLMIHCFMV